MCTNNRTLCSMKTKVSFQYLKRCNYIFAFFPFLKVHCKYYWLFIRDRMFSMIYIFRSSGGKLVLLENSMRTKKWYLCELQGLHMLPKILYFYKTLPAMVECITSDNEKCQRLDSRLSFLNSKIWTIKVNDNHKYISNVCFMKSSSGTAQCAAPNSPWEFYSGEDKRNR